MSGAGDQGFIHLRVRSAYSLLEGAIKAGKVPTKYKNQMMLQLACTGRKWCDFVSFDPRMPEHLQLFIKRIERNDMYIAELEKEVIQFLSEVDDKVKKLNEIKV